MINKQQIEFTNKIYFQIIGWYKSAESKAQIILTLITTIIVFSTGIIISDPDNLKKTIALFDLKIYISLSITALSMLYGLFNAFLCLQSNLGFKKPVEDPTVFMYPEDEMYFFGHHAYHKPGKLFNSLKRLDEERQIKAYSFQIVALSKNVLAKHAYVNRSFLSICISVIFLLIFVTFYLTNIK